MAPQTSVLFKNAHINWHYPKENEINLFFPFYGKSLFIILYLIAKYFYGCCTEIG